MNFDRVQLGFQFAKELSAQLTTLSTALIGLTITFTKDFVRGGGTRRWLLLWSWLLHLLSIMCGFWSLAALTGDLMPGDANKIAELAKATFTLGPNVRLPAAAQIVLFLLGTMGMVWYGYVNARARERSAAPTSLE